MKDEPLKLDTSGIFEDEPKEPSPEAKEFGGFIQEVVGSMFSSIPPPAPPDIVFIVKLVRPNEIEAELLSLLQAGYMILQGVIQISDGRLLLVMQKIIHKVPEALDSDQLNSDEKKDTIEG